MLSDFCLNGAEEAADEESPPLLPDLARTASAAAECRAIAAMDCRARGDS